MNTFFTDEEHQFLRGITLAAVAHTSRALERMLHTAVIPEGFAVRRGHEEMVPLLDELSKRPAGEVKVLRTTILGDFEGETYVFITPETEKQVCKALLPASMLGRPEMREGMLMELDNILIAALVTKFSDYLKAEMNGHVPSVISYNDALKTEIKGYFNTEDFPFRFTADLYSMKTEMNIPIFGAIKGDNLQKRVQELLARREGETLDFEELEAIKREEKKRKKGGFFDKIFKWE